MSTANGDSVNTLLLSKGDKQAIATYHWQEGMVDPEPVRQFLDLMSAWDMSHGYFVSNGQFTLQVEDMVAGRPVQLIDGRELASLLKAASEEAATRSLRRCKRWMMRTPVTSRAVVRESGSSAGGAT